MISLWWPRTTKHGFGKRRRVLFALQLETKGGAPRTILLDRLVGCGCLFLTKLSGVLNVMRGHIRFFPNFTIQLEDGHPNPSLLRRLAIAGLDKVGLLAKLVARTLHCDANIIQAVKRKW